MGNFDKQFHILDQRFFFTRFFVFFKLKFRAEPVLILTFRLHKSRSAQKQYDVECNNGTAEKHQGVAGSLKHASKVFYPIRFVNYFLTNLSEFREAPAG